MPFILTSLFILVSFSAYANLKECRDFNTEVIQKAVTEDAKAAGQPYRLPLDEKQALIYLQKFDAKKIGLQHNKEARLKVIKDCKTIADGNAADVFCGNGVDSYNFMRALMHASKNYAWTPSTRKLGTNILRDYIFEIQRTEFSLLDTILGIYTLDQMAKESLVPGLNIQATKQLVIDADKAEQDIKMSYQGKASGMSCQVFQQLAAQEIKSATALNQRLKVLSAPLAK